MENKNDLNKSIEIEKENLNKKLMNHQIKQDIQKSFHSDINVNIHNMYSQRNYSLDELKKV